jgi:arabinofuranosyltransferase
LATWRGVPFAKALRFGAAASLPFLAWLAFAMFWYGSPLPVTAHAKAFGLGIPAGDLGMQGLRYLRAALVDDPVLLPVVLAGLAVGLHNARTRWLALGAVLYIGDVVKVGGDFMAGRFLLPPFVVAVAILGPWLAARPWRAGIAVAVAVLALAAVRGVPQWLRSPANDTSPTEAELAAQAWVGDERRVYYATLGLLSPTRQVPVFGALDAMVRPQGGRPWILVNGAVGVTGFQAGARGTVFDALLCDPLLARLPAKDPTHLRIGHVLRRVPEGYFETVATGRNRLRHAGLARYYDALCLLTQAPPCSAERFTAMWRMAKGEFDAGLRDYVTGDYRTPPRLDVAAHELAELLPLGTYWFDEPRLRVVYDGGLAVTLPKAMPARAVGLQTTSYQAFHLRFVRDGAVVGECVAASEPQPQGLEPLRMVAGLRQERAVVPAGVGAFDAVWIDAVDTPLSHTSPVPPAVGAISFDR